MQSWLLKNTIDAVVEFFNGLITLIGDTIGGIYTNMININNNSDFISNAITFTTAFAIALVSLTAVVQYLDTYVFEVNNDPDADPLNYAIRIAQCTAFISCNGWIFNTLFNFSDNFYRDLVGTTSVSIPDNITGSLTSGTVGGLGTIAAFLIILCAIIIAFIVNAIVAAKRGAELILMKIAAPIFFVDLMTTNRERFNNFFLGYVFTFLTYSIQMFCFLMAIKSCAGILLSSMSYAWMTFGWLCLSVSGPKFLEKFIYKSGVGNAAKSGAKMAAQTIIMKR